MHRDLRLGTRLVLVVWFAPAVHVSAANRIVRWTALNWHTHTTPKMLMAPLLEVVTRTH